MELLIGFLIFIAAMAACLMFDITTVAALGVGLIVFIILGMRKGFSFKKMIEFTITGGKSGFVVARVLILIGIITAIWRTSGTIPFFIYYGIKLISPNYFIIITFLLSSLLAYSLGTSFGVAGTVGVIFMSLARSGNVNEIITAGAVMSGVFFGDRGSPVSSSAVLVATITKTDLIDNVKRMFQTALLPMVACIVFFTYMSFQNPIHGVDTETMNALNSGFSLTWWNVVPALCMIILPLLRIDVIWALISSITTGAFIALFIQHDTILTILRQSIVGYEADGSKLGSILGGGGMLSMIEVIAIVLLSSTYSGIFDGTGMLQKLEALLDTAVEKTGKFFVMLIMSFFTGGVFCNQTIASIMCSDLMKNVYVNNDGTKEELALDIENSAILTSSLVPWNIACIVPLGFLGVGIEALPYCMYLYMVPIMYFFTKRFVKFPKVGSTDI